jgi:hypothetical protein
MQLTFDFDFFNEQKIPLYVQLELYLNIRDEIYTMKERKSI